MKKVILFSVLGFLSFTQANAAEMVSRTEVSRYHLTKVGTVSVMDSAGAVSSPSDLHQLLSAKADAAGGKYYLITAAREHGPNFEAAALVYK